jgi:hypothetical protein
LRAKTQGYPVCWWVFEQEWWARLMTVDFNVLLQTAYCASMSNGVGLEIWDKIL